MRKVDPKVEEAVETLNMKDGPSRRKLLSGTGLMTLAFISNSSGHDEAAGKFHKENEDE